MTAANQKRPDNIYRGRFAPSPSGPLHFGSLITALASYIHAKQQQGTWLVRIEDIDPPRSQPGSSALILKALESYGLHWDETELFQSSQSEYYRSILADLKKHKLLYACTCRRLDIRAQGGIYQGHCRHLQHPFIGNAQRCVNLYPFVNFTDLFQGQVSCDKNFASEDFILFRKDGLFAYQLAVVADDIYQNISHVVRGCDLLEPTVRQLSLYKTLQQSAPQFGHIPLAVDHTGFKLSKQNKAPALDLKNPAATLVKALIFLGQKPPADLVTNSVNDVLAWAVKETNFAYFQGQREIVV